MKMGLWRAWLLAHGCTHVGMEGTGVEDLGETYLDQLDQQRATRTLVRRLEALGHHVELRPNTG